MTGNDDTMEHSGDDLRAIVDSLPGVALSLERNGRIRYVSPRVHRVLGHEPAGLEGRTLLDLVHPDDRVSVERALAEGADGNETRVPECRLRHDNGSWRLIELRLGPGGPEWIAGLALARDGAGDAMPSGRRLAHDLNNHLSTILGFSELLLADLPENDPYREDLAEIHKAGKSALRLTSRLADALKGGRSGP